MIEVHFFHGFLGEQLDWSRMIEDGVGADTKIVTHNLVEDFSKIDQPWSLSSWARFKEGELAQTGSKKVLVGYSMGARLIMHIRRDPSLFWVALAGHPGFVRQKDRENRKLWVQDWIQKSIELPFERWIDLWNSQEIFKKDHKRPVRNLDASRLRIWMDIMEATSLDKQELLDPFMRQNADRIWWVYGSDDDNYSAMKDRIQSCLGPEHTIRVEGVGHGLPFEKPEIMTSVLKEIVKSVE